MKKREQGFIPIILIVGGVAILIFFGFLAFMFFGGTKSGSEVSNATPSPRVETQATKISPEAQRVLDEGVDYRTLKCPDTDLTGCDDKNEGDNPTFID